MMDHLSSLSLPGLERSAPSEGSASPSTKVCIICGAGFSSAYPKTKTCGTKCSEENGRRLTKARRPPRETTKVCVRCGKTFEPTRKDAMLCGEACKKAHAKDYHARWKTERGRDLPKETRPCEVCGTSFQVGRRTRHCSVPCEKIGYKTQRSCPPKERTSKACLNCGKAFPGKGNQRHCSKDCCLLHKLAASSLGKRFKLTPDEYDRMLAAQDGRCAICRCEGTARPGSERLAIDHDHATGKVRGLLCMNCNQGLGHFRDSPTTLATAIAYLAASEAK